MQRTVLEGERRRARDSRLALAGLLALSLAANLALSASLASREGMTVLVPAAGGTGLGGRRELGPGGGIWKTWRARRRRRC